MNLLDDPATKAIDLGSRVNLIKRAVSMVPKTSDGLPTGIYRPDLIPILDSPSQPQPPSPDGLVGTPDQQLMSLDDLERILEPSFIPLTYEQGFPTLPNGLPFWYRQEFEPELQFNLFSIFLDQHTSEPRSLHALILNAEAVNHLKAQNYSVAPETLLPLLQEWYYTYYWQARARAYDLYRESAYRHLRLQRALSIEDTHYAEATTLLAKLREKYIDTDAFWNELTPKVAIDLYKQLTTMQRISAGLPAAGPSGSGKGGDGEDTVTSFELISRRIAKKNVPDSGTTIDESGRIIEANRMLEGALEDPEEAILMQELIIRMSSRTHGGDDGLSNTRTGEGQRGKQSSTATATNRPPIEISADEDAAGLINEFGLK